MASAAKRVLPLFDRVLVRKFKPAARSIGGIVLPEKAQANTNEGTVVAVGPGARNARTGEIIPVTAVKVGDKVLLPPYGGTTVQLSEKEDDEHFLFRADDILGVLKE